jgi:hypothetical protein
MSLPFAGWQQIELPDDLTDSRQKTLIRIFMLV